MLNSTTRPGAISTWIKQAHKPDDMPDVTPYIDTFGDQWRDWRVSLQPKEESSDEARDTSKYAELKKAGPNGLYLFMLALVWWGGGVSDGGEEKQAVWCNTVEDFVKVVIFFNNSLREIAGRKRRGDSPETTSKTKYVPH